MATKSFSIEPVVKTITVACTPEQAFRYFTADLSKWWPIATHSVVAYASEFKDKPATAIFEPRVGGRIFRTHALRPRAHLGKRACMGAASARGVQLPSRSR